MTAITPLSSAEPASRPVPLPDVTVAPPPALTAFAGRLNRAQATEKTFELPEYTIRYEVEGLNISMQVLDPTGRVVRSVPPEELMNAILDENLRKPRIDIRG